MKKSRQTKVVFWWEMPLDNRHTKTTMALKMVSKNQLWFRNPEQ
jgi:hypothetical protein